MMGVHVSIQPRAPRWLNDAIIIAPENMYIIIIIYHDFLPTPRRGSHVKSDKIHTQSSRYTP